MKLLIFMLLIVNEDGCKSCHSPEYLLNKGKIGSPKIIMEEYGEGVKVIFAFEVKGVGFSIKYMEIEWVKRGRHSMGDMANCVVCHKVTRAQYILM